jgi:selenide,water dikinase
VPKDKIRLTRLIQGGGGKVAPEVLREILAGIRPGIIPPQLLVGREDGDDAAVYQIGERQAIVATTDFFTPIVDDPFDFGRVAATSALSNIYAMGATPLFALAQVGMPVNVLPLEAIAGILDGGESVCRKVGIPVAGGHTIESLEPVYGLVVIGLVDPARLRRNAGARPGDRLILGKQLGIGIYGMALKRGELSTSDYEAMIGSATRLNTPGPVLACLDGVHALTDVAGSGLLGHLQGVCRRSAVGARVRFAALPLLAQALAFAGAGYVGVAAQRNWVSLADDVTPGGGIGDKERAVLTDPQASGGLLVSCSPEAATEVLSIFLQQGFSHVSVIGEVVEGKPAIEVF